MSVNRWREYRESKGMTLEEAARELGITRQHLSKIELSQVNTTTEKLIAACRLYDCQMGDLHPVNQKETVRV